MALHLPLPAARLLLRCRTPTSSCLVRSVRAADAFAARRAALAAQPPSPSRQHRLRSLQSATQRQQQCGSPLASAPAAHRQHSSSATAAEAQRSSSVMHSQSHSTAGPYASAVAATAGPDAALTAPGSTTVTAEELAAAHLAAIDGMRSKAFALPEGGIPPEWAALEPLPPNTKPPPGEQHASARRALWRVLNHKEPFCCPACRQPIYKQDVLSRHLRACCPDLLSPQDLAVLGGSSEEALRLMLREAALREAALQHRGMDLGFRQLDADGQPIRRSGAEVASIMGLPEKRMKRMLRLAMKAIPLRHDAEPLDILFEDEHLIAFNKPPGVLTAPKHRYMGGSMVNRIIPYLGYMPHVLHRLDMYTSGVVVFAKTLPATRHVHAQFRRRTVEKRYLAIIAGVPAETDFVVDAPIDRHPVDKLVRVTTSPDGLPSSTAFSVLASNAGADLSSGRRGQFVAAPRAPDRGAALVSCAPLTGRTHQIRVHLGHVGHPIIGDDFYGILGPWIGRQALHAAALAIDHPVTGQRIQFQAPPLDDFQRAMVALGLLGHSSMDTGVE